MTSDSNFPGSGLLADLFEEKVTGLWRDSDLASVYRHLMSAPAAVTLEELRAGSAAKFAAVVAPGRVAINSFSDLLEHPCPPVELFQMTKSVAKETRNHAGIVLPTAVVNVLYYLSIAGALVRCGQRISELDDDQLRQAMQWAAAQDWIDELTRSALKSAIGLIRQPT